MLAFMAFVSGVSVGYIAGNVLPLKKPEKEIRYVERMPSLHQGRRLFPEVPPAPTEK